jgi:hypothetical protein
MADDSDNREADDAPRQGSRQNSRNERLKLALRDNLKRRKSQARARSNQARDNMTEASSNDHPATLDDEAGRDGGG